MHEGSHKSVIILPKYDKSIACWCILILYFTTPLLPYTYHLFTTILCWKEILSYEVQSILCDVGEKYCSILFMKCKSIKRINHKKVSWGRMVCLWSGPSGFNWWTSVAPAFQSWFAVEYCLVSSQWRILIYMFAVLIHWWVQVLHADRITSMCIWTTTKPMVRLLERKTGLSPK